MIDLDSLPDNRRHFGVYEAIDKLPAALKTVAELHWLDKLSHREIAERHGFSARTSMRRLAAAKKLIREGLCEKF